MNAILADRYAVEFDQSRRALPGAYLPWLAQVREEALTAFLDIGFPSLRDEDWKYTSVAPIEKSRFLLAPTTPRDGIDAAGAAALALPGARLMTFVDGRFAPALSSIGDLPAGTVVASLAAVLERSPEHLQPLLGYPALGYASGFAALNTAFMSDGAYIHVPAGTAIDEPLHLLYLGAAPGLVAHNRNLIVAEGGSRIAIVEHHAALGAGSYFANVVTDIAIGRGAVVEHYKLQEESAQAFHIAAVTARLAHDARLVSASFAFGGGLVRTDIDVRLNGELASCSLDGLYMTDGTQHVDHHTRIDHAQPRCVSREFYKGILDGASRAVFNGKVIVRPNAQRSDAQQTNRNLLLSEQAEVDTKPQLEIWADDVKCGHGATVGQLDADHVFYLRSRGVGAAAARAMLVFAFAFEMIERVALRPLRERLETQLRARLRPRAGGLQ